jgi:hypothetical protein
MVFDGESKEVSAAELFFLEFMAELAAEKDPGKYSYARCKRLVVALLEAKSKLYHAAAKILGHAQLHGVLDPVIDKNDLEHFVRPLFADNVLVCWHDHGKFALNVTCEKDRVLYSTKSLNSDMF